MNESRVLLCPDSDVQEIAQLCGRLYTDCKPICMHYRIRMMVLNVKYMDGLMPFREIEYLSYSSKYERF